MPNIRDTISLVPDDELRGWLFRFFTKNYGELSLRMDVERWYSSLGGEASNGSIREKMDIYNVVGMDQSTLIRQLKEVPVWIDSRTAICNAYRPTVCLYGLLYLLTKNT